jgi:hypothetical protein
MNTRSRFDLKWNKTSSVQVCPVDDGRGVEVLTYVSVCNITPAVLARVARWFIFKPNPQFWYILEDLWMDNFDIFYGHLGYFVAICFILWQEYFLAFYLMFWYIVLRKI